MPNLVGLVNPTYVAGDLYIPVVDDSALARRLSAASETLECSMNVNVNGSSQSAVTLMLVSVEGPVA